MTTCALFGPPGAGGAFFPKSLATSTCSTPLPRVVEPTPTTVPHHLGPGEIDVITQTQMRALSYPACLTFL